MHTKRQFDRFRLFGWLTVASLVLCLPGAGQIIHTDSLASQVLGRTMRYIVLEPDTRTPGERLPGLILLHGYTGHERDWIDHSDIQSYSRSLRGVIVMPDGENSWYVDARADSSRRFETYILREVIPGAAASYAIDTSKLAIAGLSMGGYGALDMGLRHPGMFFLIGALSASLDVPNGIPFLDQWGRAGLKRSLISVFGDSASTFWNEHDVFHLATVIDSSKTPYIYLANGIQDQFAGRLPLYRRFADLLRSRALPYEYHETPGRHNWEYWDREIRGVLAKFRELSEPHTH